MTIPCKDCLVYAICKIRIYQNETTINGGVSMLLDKIKCTHLKTYLGREPFKKVNNVREVFDLYRVLEFDR